MRPSSLIPVASTMISSVGYDSSSSQLYVQFANGAIWEYDDVPEEEFSGLIGGGSPGTFFRNNIKDSFDGREI